MSDRRALMFAGGGACAFAALPAFARIAVQAPASAGFTAAGVADLNAKMHALVDGQKLAGVVTLLARNGKVVNLDAYGKQDASGGRADGDRLHLPHRLDDQADLRRGDDAAL